jgi:purine catabolism regulator
MSRTVQSLQSPTLAEVLQLRPVREGQAEVVVAGRGLDRRVRWGHVAETPDIGIMLTGDEVVLTTGQLLRESEVQESFVAELAGADAAALLLGMGRAFDTVPPALVAACRRHGLPLIVMWRPIAFVTITEAIQALCAERGAARARLSEQVRDTLSGLTLDRAPMQALVAELAQLAGCPVVVENLSRQVLLSAGRSGLGEVLRDWARLSHAISREAGAQPLHRTQDGVVAAQLLNGGRPWGRLIFFAHAVPQDRVMVIAERGAQALTLHRMAAGSGADWERQAAHSLFDDLMSGSHTADAIALRARAAGFPIQHASLVPLIVQVLRRTGGPAAEHSALAERARRIAQQGQLALLVGPAAGPTLTMLISVPHDVEPGVAVADFARRLRAELGQPLGCVAAGYAVTATGQLSRSLQEAQQVFATGDTREPLVQLADLRVAGLVRMLADDDHVQAFVDRELGPLLDNPELIELLECFLRCNLNKSLTAEASHLSRPAVYRRLDQISALLHTDLDDVRAVASLYVALLGLRARQT